MHITYLHKLDLTPLRKEKNVSTHQQEHAGRQARVTI